MPIEDKVTRKLRAILSADVKGYSLLMSDDEIHTIQTLKTYRQIMSEYVQRHTGRVVDSPGDNMLAEFGSAVDAVQCAVEVQKRLKRENERFVEDKRVQFRIGVNIGDVVQDGKRIYGNGVNVASRIEGLAEQGGVSISRNVYDHIRDKLELGYEYLGEHSVKNIKHPVRVYKILLDSEDAGKLIGKKPPSSSNKWISLAVVVAAMVLFLIVWQFYQKEPEPTGKPSIAVLPFENMSNDPDQEYFSDGMTDELIGDLAKIKDLFVISRNSAFTYKGKSTKIRQVAKELNVQYILEGSVQKSGKKVRIRAQLIDGKTDHHLWSESYDGTMDDIFELQDKITGKIVSALSVELSSSEKERITDQGTENLLAYDAFLKGCEHYSQMKGENILKAIEYYQQAVEIDPNFTRAYSELAMTNWLITTNTFLRQLDISSPSQIGAFKYKARQYLELAMKNPTFETYRVAAFMSIFRRHFDDAVSYAEKAISLAPNEIIANSTMGFILTYVGRADEALSYLDKAIQLDPRFLGNLLGRKGLAHFVMGNYDKAVGLIERCLTLNPGLNVYASFAAASYAFMDRQKEAEEAWNIFKDGFPEGMFPSTRFLYFGFPFKDQEVFERYIKGLAKAGFEGDLSDYSNVHVKNRLNGQEIKELLFGKTRTGYIMGYEVSFSVNQEGKLIYSFSKGGFILFGDTGTSWIEGDSICNQLEQQFGGIKFYQDIYFNPEGDKISKNEYIAISDMSIIPFSIVE